MEKIFANTYVVCVYIRADMSRKEFLLQLKKKRIPTKYKRLTT